MDDDPLAAFDYPDEQSSVLPQQFRVVESTDPDTFEPVVYLAVMLPDGTEHNLIMSIDTAEQLAVTLGEAAANGRAKGTDPS